MPARRKPEELKKEGHMLWFYKDDWARIVETANQKRMTLSACVWEAAKRGLEKLRSE